MTLHVPVEGGHEGGRLVIEHHDETRILDLSSNSHQNFYMTVVHADSDIEMQPILSGRRMELVFHMKWKHPAIVLYPPLPDISAFLVALTKLKKDLKSWLEHTSEDGLTKMLVIGLEHNYDPLSHSFATLEGQDRSVAHLIRSAALLEVHLARLTRHVTGSVQAGILNIEASEDEWRNSKASKSVSIKEVHRTVHTVSHWMGVDDCAAQFQGLDIDTQSQFVGSVFKPNAQPDQRKLVPYPDFSGRTLNLWYHQTVLILWPKSKSFYFDLRYRFDHLLDRMERESMTKPTELLKNVVSMSNICTLTSLRLCRLLNLCLRCKDAEKASRLLEMMVNQSVGIPSTDAAYLIAEIGSTLINWHRFETYVSQLMTCKPEEQMIHLVALSLAFLERNALDGFVMVSKHNWEVFINQLRTSATIDRTTLAACVQMAIKMEEQAETIDLTRFDDLFSCFIELKVLQQCYLVIDMQHKSKKSLVGQHLFQRLCHHVVRVAEPTDKSLEDCVVDFVHSLKADDNISETLDLFIDKLCQPLYSTADNHLLRKLVSSLTSINLPVDLIVRLLNARIIELKSSEPPRKTWEFEKAEFQGADRHPDVVEFLKSPKPKMFKSGFRNIEEARKFESEYFGVMDTCVQLGYSAMVDIKGTGRSVRCQIIKTCHLYLARKAKFDACKGEMIRLIKLRAALGFQQADDCFLTESCSDQSEIESPQVIKRRKVTRN